MSAEPAPVSTTRPIPVSSQADHEPAPRFRWVAPLFIGLALGAILGGAVTFTIMVLTSKSRAELFARQFNPSGLLAGLPEGAEIQVTSDTTTELGAMGRRGIRGSAIRRRIVLDGSVPAGTNLENLATQVKARIDADLTRAGCWPSGGGSTTSSGPEEYSGTFDSSYYTHDGRQGQSDLQIEAKGRNFHATLVLFEAR